MVVEQVTKVTPLKSPPLNDQNILANLLAASLASNLGLEGCCMRIEADINVGFACPSGSRPRLKFVMEFPCPLDDASTVDTEYDLESG